MDAKRLRQITDNIQETIYLSQLETDMSSTAIFYRLNDVYQSSTVYMTFPSNRTKRYEHSIGTMQVASDIFYYSVANADYNVVNNFLKAVKSEFYVLFDSIRKDNRGGKGLKLYQINYVREWIHSYEGKKQSKFFKEELTKAIENKDIEYDKALMHFIPSAFARELQFFYVCVLEALRLVSLFHDVGHPPFSHIIEAALKSIYDEIESVADEKRTERMDSFLECTKKYLKRVNLDSVKEDEESLRYLEAKKYTIAPETHEAIGLTMLHKAFDQCLYEKLISLESSDRDKRTWAIIYYITVYEFAFAILREKSPLWAGLHKIVDGCFDADRLDYIVRDSINSGVNWGSVAYKRIVESSKMIIPPEEDCEKWAYCTAYQRKLKDDIDDILTIRFKIFSRINSNHKCIKTSILLQKVVKSISLTYLRAKTREDYENCSAGEDDSAETIYGDGIEDLWKVLNSSWGKEDLSISKWNDSWLTTVLQNSLISLEHELPRMNPNVDQKEYRNIKACLEVLLMNYSNYFGFIKRGSDLEELYKKIIEKSNLTEKKLQEHLEILKKQEIESRSEKFKSMIQELSNDDPQIMDSFSDNQNWIQFFDKEDYVYHSMKIRKLDIILQYLQAEEIAPILEIELPIIDWNKVKEHIMEYDRENIQVEDCLLYDKPVKTGIEKLVKKINPLENEQEKIYLYDYEGKIVEYDPSCLNGVLQSLQSNCNSVYFYIRFNNRCKKPKEEIGSIAEYVTDFLVEKVKRMYENDIGLSLD